MKFILITFKSILLFLILLLLNGCNKSDNNKLKDKNVDNKPTTNETVISENYNIFDKKTNTTDDITMEVINISNKSAKVVVTNNSNTKIVGDNVFGIQVLKDGYWYELPYIVENENFGFLGHGITIESSGSLEYDVMWESYYGELGEGYYRIINNFSTFDENEDNYLNEFYLSSEFEIS